MLLLFDPDAVEAAIVGASLLVAAEADLALIADRKAPSLGLKSPTETSADSGR